ncbi:MAG: hypothetical protein ABSG90_13350 [Dehalococcoidia bacterium]
MKKEERLPYLILTEVHYGKHDLGNATLCSFCKYGQWEGDSCCEGYYECMHPVGEIREKCAEKFQDNPGNGVDCWAFRPLYSQEDCVDMVGVWLIGRAVDMTNVPERRRK